MPQKKLNLVLRLMEMINKDFLYLLSPAVFALIMTFVRNVKQKKESIIPITSLQNCAIMFLELAAKMVRWFQF